MPHAIPQTKIAPIKRSGNWWTKNDLLGNDLLGRRQLSWTYFGSAHNAPPFPILQ